MQLTNVLERCDFFAVSTADITRNGCVSLIIGDTVIYELVCSLLGLVQSRNMLIMADLLSEW